jgi:hypothetical protein
MVYAARDGLLRVLLWLPWGILLIGGPLMLFWYLEPVPVQITYVAPSFLREPAYNREEAAQHYVAEIQGGTTVWRYVEYCVTKPYNGTSHRSWISAALVWHAPDLPTQFSRAVGCGSFSVAVDVPQSSPSRNFMFVQRLEVPVNPIKTVDVEYPPIPLRILAPEDCRK